MNDRKLRPKAARQAICVHWEKEPMTHRGSFRDWVWSYVRRGTTSGSEIAFESRAAGALKDALCLHGSMKPALAPSEACVSGRLIVFFVGRAELSSIATAGISSSPSSSTRHAGLLPAMSRNISPKMRQRTSCRDSNMLDSYGAPFQRDFCTPWSLLL
jgi:hypothetical protein